MSGGGVLAVCTDLDWRSVLQYVRDIYQMPSMAKTVNMQHIKLHYYASHTHLNAFGIVAAGPNVEFTLPHNRNRFDSSL